MTNTSPGQAVYPAALWINHTIEAIKTIVFTTGGTTRFQFNIIQPEGAYRMRVERLLGEYVVGVPPVTPTPTPAPVYACTSCHSHTCAATTYSYGHIGVHTYTRADTYVHTSIHSHTCANDTHSSKYTSAHSYTNTDISLWWLVG